MKYLLDTHVVLWWLFDDRKLPKHHAKLLERAHSTGDLVALSAMSLWEIAKLGQLDRLDMDETTSELLDRIESNAMFTVLPLTGKIALESTLLGARFPGDPGDQLIAATARCHGLTLLTADQRIIDSGAVSVA